MRVVVGTRNRAKASELAAVLAGIAEVEVAPSNISPQLLINDEGDYQSLESAAAAKAVAWSRVMAVSGEGDVPVVASDGGLLIPGLGAAWDPLRTRRFAGESATDRQRADALLALAAGLGGEERQIGWREAVAVARDGALVTTLVAESPLGILARDYDPALVESGKGFWVPALWICPQFGGKRLAELTTEERGVRPDHWQRLGRELRVTLKAISQMGPEAGSSERDASIRTTDH